MREPAKTPRTLGDFVRTRWVAIVGIAGCCAGGYWFAAPGPSEALAIRAATAAVFDLAVGLAFANYMGWVRRK